MTSFYVHQSTTENGLYTVKHVKEKYGTLHRLKINYKL